MSFINILMRSNLISKGCKLYYTHLVNLSKASKINGWKITSGKYKNQNFIIAADKTISQKFDISLTSIYKYKKALKSLGLIDTLKKFTTKTNKSKNYHHRQLTVVVKTLPKKLISKLLTYIKATKIIRFSSNIVPYFKKNLNNTFKNIHTKIKKIVNNVKKSNYNYGNLTKNNQKDIQVVSDTLNMYNIKFKEYEIDSYVSLYKKSNSIFFETSRYCSKKNMYSPLKYFTKTFFSFKKPLNHFFNFPQRGYNYDELEKILVHNNKGLL